ncbi:MAG: SIS domain-containing protein, partial [Planctomycetes bacterium]|nr:SIS domain-containing protein [Planctomycetota bacterium]
MNTDTPQAIIAYGREVIRAESAALQSLTARLDRRFAQAVGLVLNCTGRVAVTGIGKAGIVGQKISATLASTGTPSFWLQASEARHGDLGRIVREDLVLILSNSGETE